MCIGKAFALMEMQLALATIVQTYSLRLFVERPVVPHLATTLQPGWSVDDCARQQLNRATPIGTPMSVPVRVLACCKRQMDNSHAV